MRPKDLFDLLKQAFAEFGADKVPRLGAALAYYTVFSLAPLLVVLISIVGLVYGQQAAQGQIQGQIEGAVGRDAAAMIQTMVANTGHRASGIIGTIVGLATLLLGAAGIFGQLKDSLNTIWGVQPPPGRGIMGYVRSQALSFLAVLGTGALLLASLVLSAVLAAVGGFLSSLVPGLGTILQIANYVLSFAIITLLFAMIYKILPDTKIDWRDVWVGAAITSVLFVVGQLAIGLYLGHAAVGSTYGAAGSLIVLLLWMYYSAQVLFFGAELTQVYANRYGSKFGTIEAQAAQNARSKQPTAVPQEAASATQPSDRRVQEAHRQEPIKTIGPIYGDWGDGTALASYAPLALVGLVLGFVVGRQVR